MTKSDSNDQTVTERNNNGNRIHQRQATLHKHNSG